eukprot:5519811-Lingulodinium_polyedra.AAC.1
MSLRPLWPRLPLLWLHLLAAPRGRAFPSPSRRPRCSTWSGASAPAPHCGSFSSSLSSSTGGGWAPMPTSWNPFRSK